jgi:hypothetical protein
MKEEECKKGDMAKSDRTLKEAEGRTMTVA